MGVDPIARRTVLSAAGVGLGAAAAVYAGNDWFHASVLPAVGLSHAVGSLFIVIAAFLGQRPAAAASASVATPRPRTSLQPALAAAADFERF